MFQIFQWSDYVIPTTLNLSPFLKILLEPVNGEKKINEIELGLHEALVNAVKHGNLEDPRKFLRIRRIITPNWMVWQVQDEGSGLPEYAKRASLPSRIDANTGRGIYIIYQCFDDVRWSNKGNRLQLATRRKIK